MLQLNKIILLSTIFFATSANAGLYGLDIANPITKEELVSDETYFDTNTINYPQKMRDNIIMLSSYGKKNNKNFQIIVHEGQDLNAKTDYEIGLEGLNLALQGLEDPTFLSKKRKPYELQTQYLNAIDGVVKNKVFFKDGTTKAIKDSNTKNIYTFSDVQNYWISVDDDEFDTKQDKITAILNSNYDLVVINPMFNNKQRYTPEEISSMRLKKNGTKRLLLAQIDLAEISPNDYRFKNNWALGKNEFLRRKSLVNKNDYIVEYWSQNWQKLLSRHFKSALAYMYDGVFLTGADNHKYFQRINPVD